jgi:hypothetical protein
LAVKNSKNMEDIFKFLLVIGTIVFGIVRQVKKEAKKNAGQRSAVPIPDTKNKLPENRDDETYGGFIPKGPELENITITEKKSSHRTNTPLKKKFSSPVPEEVQETDEVSEFNIRSTEEARRAIIWSEILQRKY